MSNSMKLKVFFMNEHDWWQAPSLEEAINDYSSHTGMLVEEIKQDNPRELSSDEMKKLKYYDDPPFDGPNCRSFAEELDERNKRKEHTGPFATTEY